MDGIDFGQLNELSAELEPEDVRAIFSDFTDDIHEGFQTLTQAIALGRVEDAIRALHEVKGCALNIGLVRLAEVCGRYERALSKSPDLAAIPLGKIDRLVKSGCSAVQDALDTAA